jgi:hypothetical protein
VLHHLGNARLFGVWKGRAGGTEVGLPEPRMPAPMVVIFAGQPDAALVLAGARCDVPMEGPRSAFCSSCLQSSPYAVFFRPDATACVLGSLQAKNRTEPEEGGSSRYKGNYSLLRHALGLRTRNAVRASSQWGAMIRGNAGPAGCLMPLKALMGARDVVVAGTTTKVPGVGLCAPYLGARRCSDCAAAQPDLSLSGLALNCDLEGCCEDGDARRWLTILMYVD